MCLPFPPASRTGTRRADKPMAPKPDIYTRITDKVIGDLEACTRPWYKPWQAEPLARHISRPLRHNSIAHRGLNIFLLWPSSAPAAMSHRPV